MNFCVAYPNKNNYSETFIYNHIQYLNPPHVLFGGWRPYRTIENKSIFDFPFSEPFRILLKRFFPKYYHQFYTQYLKKFLKKNNIQTVLAEYGVLGTCVMDACIATETPYIVHFHGFDASDKNTLESFRLDYQKMFETCKAICVVSWDMKKALLNLGAPESKIHHTPYGVNTSLFEQKSYSSGKNLIAVGRFTAKKAPHLTLKAFARVLKEEPEAKLSMIGTGELWEDAKKLALDLKINNHVEFLGVKKPQEIAYLLQKSDIFVQHSMIDVVTGDSEGTPNTILEAACTGLPIVSTFHAGIKEAVDNEKTGFLVEEGDWESMADKMIFLLKNPAIAEQMGRAGRQKMQREYHLESQIEKLHQIIIHSIS
ncbi:MAG: glycosyltransferase family 4 protein [Raineya sp.]|jgi:glycosyltransferase involved in cell wall biosynthesis|nr:glycosyltransferase family 4 protein [Raineya sp.]